MSIELSKGLERSFRINNNNRLSSPFLVNSISSSSYKLNTNKKCMSMIRQKYNHSFNSKDNRVAMTTMTTISRSTKPVILKSQPPSEEQHSLMLCRYLTNLMEDDINFLTQAMGTLLLTNKIESQKMIKMIQQNMIEFLKQYRRIGDKKKIQLMFRVISALGILQDVRVIELIPLVEFKNVVVYLSHMVEQMIEYWEMTSREWQCGQSQQRQCKQQSLLTGQNISTQWTRLSPSLEDKFRHTNSVTQTSERYKGRRKLTLQISGNNRSCSYRKLNSNSLPSGRTIKSIQKTHDKNQSQRIKQAMSLFSMARVDYVLGLVFGCIYTQPHNPSLSLFKKLIQDKLFVDVSFKMLQQFNHPVFSRKLKLYYSQKDYIQFERNCRYLCDAISSFLDVKNNKNNNKESLMKRQQQQRQQQSCNDRLNISEKRNPQLNQSYTMISTAKFESILNHQQNFIPNSSIKNTDYTKKPMFNIIKKDVDQLQSPCTPSAFERKNARKPTIEMNKILELSEGQGKITTFKALPTVAQKSKKNIVFTSTINQYIPLQNEIQNTQNQIHHQTQKSLRSNHSKSRLPRHAYQMASSLPTSGIVLKSIRNIQTSMFDKKCSKKSILPSLKPCLFTFNNLSQRKQIHWKTSKRLHHRDNFINFNVKSLSEKYDQKALKQRQFNKNICLINKKRFYQNRGFTFTTVIKRQSRFILCLVQFEQINNIQTQMQIFTGLYHQNPNLIKIISGKIFTQFFHLIIQSHQQLQNYINCELNSNFEINNTPLKKIYLKLKIKQKGIISQQEAEDNSGQIIRPKLGIQKFVKTKMLARFVLGLRSVAHLFQQDNTNTKHDHSYCLVSIFSYFEWSNRDICIQVYLPLNSKNIMFMIQEDVTFDYLSQLIHNTLAEKVFMENLKSKSIEKINASRRLSDGNTRVKKRMSIFMQQSQYQCQQHTQTQRSSFSKNKKSFLILDSKISNLKTNSVDSLTQKILTQRNQISLVSPHKSRDWNTLSVELQKLKKQIKFNQYFNFQIRDNEYFLRFTTLPDTQYKGVQVLRKKIHAKVHIKNINKKIFQIKPKALQIVSISYEVKALSLLNYFTPQIFSKVKINQRYMKFLDRFGNEIHFTESLQNALKRSNYSHQIQIGKDQKQRSPRSSHLINKIKFNVFYYLPLDKPQQAYRKDLNTISKYRQLLMEEMDQNE